MVAKARYTRLDGRLDFKRLSAHIKFWIGFLTLYLAAWMLGPLLLYRDPSSVFFNPSTAYNPMYSVRRRAESSLFIQNLSKETQSKANSLANPEICVGITSVNREGAAYLNDAVGSLLDGLAESERHRLHLIIFIAHTEPSAHPAVMQGWIPHVADTILTYKAVARGQLDRLRLLENQGGKLAEKTVFDYTYLLDACHSTGAHHTAILEDDVIALDGWFHRTKSALELARRKTKAKGLRQYFYVRLFYTEKYLGWNAEEWKKYLFYSSLATIIVCALVSIVYRLYHVSNTSTKRRTSIRTILIYAILCMALIIGFLFAIGPVSLFPKPRGVIEMPKFGCCSQGLVFPRSRVSEITSHLRMNGDRPVDSVLEEYADAHDETRWAVVPSVLQHVGSRSSKTGRESALTIFNFGFEKNDADLLKKEHLKVLGRAG